eukprot:1591689-Pyramimonas_sp.AAC.1
MTKRVYPTSNSLSRISKNYLATSEGMTRDMTPATSEYATTHHVISWTCDPVFVVYTYVLCTATLSELENGELGQVHSRAVNTPCQTLPLNRNSTCTGRSSSGMGKFGPAAVLLVCCTFMLALSGAEPTASTLEVAPTEEENNRAPWFCHGIECPKYVTYSHTKQSK